MTSIEKMKRKDRQDKNKMMFGRLPKAQEGHSCPSAHTTVPGILYNAVSHAVLISSYIIILTSSYICISKYKVV